MSTTRDYRVVEMSFDNKDFEKNVKTSLSTIQKLDKALQLDGATQGLLAVEKAIAQVTMNPILKGIDQVNEKFSALGIMGKRVLENLADSAVNAGKKIWNNTLGQIQSGGSARALNIANAQFKLEGLDVAWEKAKKDISAAVDRTAYGFDAAANTASQLATAGIELGDAYGGMAHALKAVSGIAAMTNSSYEEIGYIFSQIASAGRLMGQDAMQISTRGINVTATLAKQLNKTTEEITEMQRKGEISFAMFAEAMNDAFGDQATKANNTFQGAMSNVKAALSRIGEIFYGPFYKNMITPLNKIREAINKIKKMMDDGDDSTRDLKDRLTELLETVSKIFTYFTEHADLRFFKDVVNTANDVLDKINGVAHGWEKMLGIFGAKTAVDDVDALSKSLENLTEKEIEAARAIWTEGKYGNGEARISAMKAAGFDEDEINRVQNALNNLVESGKTWEEFQETLTQNQVETNEAIEETEAVTNSLVSSKIARTLERVGKIFTYIRMTAENLAESVMNVGKTIAESFLTVFPFDKIAGDAQSLAYHIWNLSTALIGVTKNNSTIKRIADEIFTDAYNIYRVVKSLARIAISAAKSLWTVLSKNVKGLDTSWLTLTHITDALAMFAEDLADAAENGEFFEKIFQSVIDSIKKGVEYVKKAPDLLSTAGTKIKNWIVDISERIKTLTGIDIMPFLSKVKEYFESFGKVLTNPFKTKEGGGTGSKPGIVVAAEKVKQAVIDIFNKPEELAKGISDWFNNSLSLAKNKIKSTNINDTITAFKRFKKSFKEFTDNFTININADSFLTRARNMGSIAAATISIITALNINKLVEILKKPSIQLKNIVGTVVGVFNKISFTFKTLGKNIDKVGTAVAWNIRSDVVMKIALSIAVMAGSLVAVALLPVDDMLRGLLAITTITLALGTALLAVSNIPAVEKGSKVNTTIIQATALFSVMAIMMKVLADMSYEDIAKAGLALSAMMAMMDASIAAIQWSTNLAKDKKVKEIKQTQQSLTGTVLALTAMMSSMSIAVLSISAFAHIVKDPEAMTWGVATTGGILLAAVSAIAGLSIVAQKVNVQDLSKVSKTLSLMIVSLDTMIPLFIVLSVITHLTKGEYTLAKSVGAIFSVIATSVLSLIGLSKLTNAADLTGTAAALAIVLASMNAMLPIVSVMSFIQAKFGDKVNFEDIAGLFVGLAVVGGSLLAALSALTKTVSGTNMLIAAGSIAILSASVLILAPALLALSKIDTTKLWTIVKVFTVLSAIFVILGAVDSGVGHGISIVLAAVAATFLSTGIMIKSILDSVSKIVISLGLVAKQLVETIKYFGSIDSSVIDKAADNLKISIQKLCKTFSDILPDLGQALLDFIKFLHAVVTQIGPTFLAVTGEIGTLFGLVVANIALTFIRGLEGVFDALLQVDDNGESLIYRVVYKVGKIIKDIFIAIVKAIFEEEKDAEQLIGPTQPGQNQESRNSLFEAFIHSLVDSFVQSMKVIGERSGEIADAIVVEWVKVSNALTWAINEHEDEIGAAAGNLLGALWTSFKKYWLLLKPKVTEFLWGAVTFCVRSIFNLGTEAGEKIGEWLREKRIPLFGIGEVLFRAFVRGIKSMFSAGYEAVTEFFDNFINGITDSVETIKEDMEKAGKAALGSFCDVFTPDSKSGAAALGVVGAFGNKLSKTFVKGTGTGSYNPLTGYAGEWMEKSVGIKMEKDYPKTAKWLKNIGSRLASAFTSGVTEDSEGTKKEGLLTKLTNIVKDKLGLNDIKSALGLDNEFNFDDYLNELNVNTDDFAITPVIDTSEIESGINDISDMFKSEDYDLGLTTSSDLASSIGSSYDYGTTTAITAGTDLSTLTAEVQKISDKISKLEVRIDSGALVGAITDKMNTSLGTKQVLVGRGVYA